MGVTTEVQLMKHKDCKHCEPTEKLPHLGKCKCPVPMFIYIPRGIEWDFPVEEAADKCQCFVLRDLWNED